MISIINNYDEAAFFHRCNSDCENCRQKLDRSPVSVQLLAGVKRPVLVMMAFAYPLRTLLYFSLQEEYLESRNFPEETHISSNYDSHTPCNKYTHTTYTTRTCSTLLKSYV